MAGCGERGASGCRAILEASERIFGGRAETSRLGVGEAVAAAGERAKQFGGVLGAHAAKGFNGFDADKLIAQDIVLAGSDFHELRTAEVSWARPIWSII